MRSIAWLAVGAALLSATPLFAQSTRSRVEELELRVQQLEQVLQSQTLIEMSQRIEAQAAELRELRGALESSQNDNQQLRKQLADLASDFDRRLVELERRPVMVAAPTAEAPAFLCSSADRRGGSFRRGPVQPRIRCSQGSPLSRGDRGYEGVPCGASSASACR